MVIIGENEHGDPSSNQDGAVCISHCTNTLEKDIYQIIILPWLKSRVDRTLFTLVRLSV